MMELIACNMNPLLWVIPDIGTSDQVSHNEVDLQEYRDSDIARVRSAHRSCAIPGSMSSTSTALPEIISRHSFHKCWTTRGVYGSTSWGML